MRLSLHIFPAAEQDLSEIGDYFDERSESLSYRFYERFLDSVRMLAEAPELGERYAVQSWRACMFGGCPAFQTI
jgi:plasmid stabilization system protein ParE